jgi:hypothetical protein
VWLLAEANNMDFDVALVAGFDLAQDGPSLFLGASIAQSIVASMQDTPARGELVVATG